jgi:hypothetical protein
VCPAVPSLSGFCPLDLYSCTPSRVHRALAHLLRTPQNNLRIFVREGGARDAEGEESGGTVQMIDLQDAAQIERLAHLLFPRLSKHASTDATASETHSALLLSFLTSFLCDAAPFRSLFGRLSTLQQELDRMDIEGLHPHIEQLMKIAPDALSAHRVWKGVEPQNDVQEEGPEWLPPLIASLTFPTAAAHSASVPPSPPVLNNSPNPSPPSVFEFPSQASADDTHAIDVIPQCAHCSRADGSQSPALEASPSVPTPLVAPSCVSASSCPHWHADRCCCFVVSSVRSFLLATTLKDVSLMCTMQTTPPMASAIGTTTVEGAALATRVHYSVRLIDLECKSVEKLREYHRLDQEIVAHYLTCMKLNKDGGS